MKLRSRWRVALSLLAALVLLAVAWLGLTAPGRAAVKTALLVPQLVPAIPLKPQELLGPRVERREVRFQAGDVERVGDLYYIPDGRRRGAVVLFLGVNPAGRDDPRVVNLGRALARTGMVVLVPWSDSMVERRMDPRDIDRLVHTFLYLQGRPEVDPSRVGLGGFCVGASFSLVAAADPRIRDQVAFVNFFSGYFDASDLMVQISSGTSFYKDQEAPWVPDPLTREVFAYHLRQSVSDPQERRLLEGLQPGHPLPVDLPALSPEAQVAARLLVGTSLDEAQALAPQVAPSLQRDLAAVSPSAVVDGIRAPVLVMHGQGDNLVPVEESRRLHDALRARGAPVYYTEFVLFQHMDPTRPLGAVTFVQEAAKLYLHLYRIVRAVN